MKILIIIILSWNLQGREKGLLIKDLKGGIMTISTNPKNFHNLIFYIKKKNLL